MSNLILGQKVPIVFQLSDGSEDKFVRAIIKDDSGAAIGDALTLTHDVDGKYRYGSFYMPNKHFIEVQMQAFEDDEFTAPSDYDTITETYSLLIPSGAVGELEGTVESDEELIATIGDC